MTVGIYATDNDDEQKVRMREEIGKLCKAHDGVINSHGYFIDTQEYFLTFDITLDFSVTDKAALVAEIRGEVEKVYPGYTVAINCDTNYSD